MSTNKSISIKANPSKIEFHDNAYVELPAQSMLARLSNRPAFAAMNGLFSSFPAIKIFTSNAVPIMVAREQAKERKKKKAAEEVKNTFANEM
ncbi:uncharacterized protein J8A68_005005 [[Candida] subhashii]|uniref:Uncharacterized protein n=1 Tax=[Candida] subhashii TaxID=561895 RepID=A0A8J5UIW6_9ASCO|nr:uncharacterized protein J8A68_005005 [[Candida] subhashii]KAG7661427.1 hypothetical protein J8A68_005005 [[Candida] subhashii]